MPRAARSIASVSPTGPAPTTSTLASIVSVIRLRAGRAERLVGYGLEPISHRQWLGEDDGPALLSCDVDQRLFRIVPVDRVGADGSVADQVCAVRSAASLESHDNSSLSNPTGRRDTLAASWLPSRRPERWRTSASGKPRRSGWDTDRSV